MKRIDGYIVVLREPITLRVSAILNRSQREYTFVENLPYYERAGGKLFFTPNREGARQVALKAEGRAVHLRFLGDEAYGIIRRMIAP